MLKKIFILSPRVEAIGNCAEDMYFGLLKARREGKKVFFICSHDFFWKFKFSKKGKGINRTLLKIKSPYRYLSYNNPISLLVGLVVSIWYYLKKIFTRPARCIPDIGCNKLHWSVAKHQWGEQFEEYLKVDISPKLPSGPSWFVCLHVREGGYYNFTEGSTAIVRNADIRTFIKAIKLITDSGGWVYRMGNSTMMPLPPMERVIDYAHCKELRNHMNDICLLQACRFYLGSATGIWDVADLFQRPIITVNMSEWWHSYPRRMGDLGIIKHVYSKQKGRLLTLKECLDETTEIASHSGYSLIENTENEIYQVVKEYLKNTSRPLGHSQLQEEFNKERVEASYDYLKALPNVNTQRRLTALIDGCNGTIGQQFLEENL